MARSGTQMFFLVWLAATPVLAGLICLGAVWMGEMHNYFRVLLGLAVLPTLGLLLLRVGNAVAAGVARKKRGRLAWRHDGEEQAPPD